MLRRPAFLALVALAGCATAHSTDHTPEVDGAWNLTRYGMFTVPSNVSELPVSPRDPTPSGCFRRLTRGSLTLSAASHIFRYEYEFHNTCTGLVLHKTDVQGTFTLSGTALLFSIAGGRTVSGEIGEGEIVMAEEPELRFQR